MSSPTFKYLHLNIWGKIYPDSYNSYSEHIYLATQLKSPWKWKTYIIQDRLDQTTVRKK